MRRLILHRSQTGAGLARLAVLLLLAPLPASAQAAGAQPGAGVSVVFTALGKDGKAIKDIKVDDVKVSADGVPVQPTDFKKQGEAPSSSRSR